MAARLAGFRLPRRQAIRLGAGLLIAAAGRVHAGTASVDDRQNWDRFKRRFLTEDGRIVDTANGDVSHTEGQGWGLLFAATFDDRPVFDRILLWTSKTLQRSDDALHAWRYVPGPSVPVADHNNATDGDLFIAYALTLAAARWRRPELRRHAAAIADSILRKLVRDVGGRVVLAPAVEGFESAEGLVVNPSYYAFGPLQTLATLAPSPRWAALRRDGEKLVDEGRFGAWELPPDWLLVARDGGLHPAPGYAPRYGYDAVRVPLYAAWAGVCPAVRGAAARWWRHASPPPAWVDLLDGSVAPYRADAGMTAATEVAIAGPDVELATLPGIDDAMDYYPAALCLLARVAARDLIAARSAAGPR